MTLVFTTAATLRIVHGNKEMIISVVTTQSKVLLISCCWCLYIFRRSKIKQFCSIITEVLLVVRKCYGRWHFFHRCLPGNAEQLLKQQQT